MCSGVHGAGGALAWEAHLVGDLRDQHPPHRGDHLTALHHGANEPRLPSPQRRELLRGRRVGVRQEPSLATN